MCCTFCRDKRICHHTWRTRDSGYGRGYWQLCVFFFHVSLHGLLLDSYRIIIRKMQYFCCQRIDNTDSICNLLTCWYRQLYGEMLRCNSWVLVMSPTPKKTNCTPHPHPLQYEDMVSEALTLDLNSQRIDNWIKFVRGVILYSAMSNGSELVFYDSVLLRVLESRHLVVKYYIK